MIILRIDDVGRLPTDTPEQGSDPDLSYFAEWRLGAGLAGLPVVYGVVPQWISQEGIWWLESAIYGKERVAIHGYSHRRGEEVTTEQMRAAREAFCDPPETYIPPYNAYNGPTIQSWAEAGGRYFLGGFPLEHHGYGSEPELLYNGVVHLSASRKAYGRAGELISRLPPVRAYPTVLTLHVPWETEPSQVARLVGIIRPRLTPLEYLEQWLG